MSDSEEDTIYPPWNFSWIVPNQLAVMSCPRTPENIRWIEKQGVKHLITLSPERRPAIHAAKSLEWTEIGVEEFEAPTMAQIKKFIEVCQRCLLKNQPVGVHCRQGLGRSGVMAACYLIQFANQHPERAVINVRLQRPGSIETDEQERMVTYYYDCIKGIKGTY